MDNLTHSLVGWALGQAGLKRKTRKGLAALILGANMPDIDVFLGWVPWAPLAIHRGWTHSLVGGVLLMPPLVAGLLWLLDRWQVRRGADFGRGLAMHFGWLVALSYAGAVTHPLLDWQTSYAIQLFSPFSNAWFHTDSLFIIDAWIWLILGAAIWLSRRRERRGSGDWSKPAVAALAVLVAYIAANGALTVRAKAAPVGQPPHARPDVIVATPPPLLFWRREVIWRQDGAMARGAFDPFESLSRLHGVTPPEPDGMADPIARRGMTASRAVVAFMRWSILPMAQVERGRCSARVLYEDARFGGRPTVRTMRLAVAVPLEREGCPAARS
jgi:inner membrane protein